MQSSYCVWYKVSQGNSSYHLIVTYCMRSEVSHCTENFPDIFQLKNDLMADVEYGRETSVRAYININ